MAALNILLFSSTFTGGHETAPFYFHSTSKSTIIDRKALCFLILSYGSYKTSQILSSDMHSIMMTPTFTINNDRKISVGLSWFMYPYQGAINYEHGGSDLGYKSMLTLIPEKKIGIIILCNLEEIRIHDTRNKVRDILLAKYDNAISQ